MIIICCYFFPNTYNFENSTEIPIIQTIDPDDGHYKGSETFRDDNVGSFPLNWIPQGTNPNIQVYSEENGHKNVLEFSESTGGAGCQLIFPTESPIINIQYIEFWLAVDYTTTTSGSNSGFSFILRDISLENRIWLTWGAHLDGFWNVQVVLDGVAQSNIYEYNKDYLLQENQWIHIRLAMDYVSHVVRIYFDNMVVYEFQGDNFNSWGALESFSFYSAWTYPESIWLDSFSWSWDPNYNINDLLTIEDLNTGDTTTSDDSTDTTTSDDSTDTTTSDDSTDTTTSDDLDENVSLISKFFQNSFLIIIGGILLITLIGGGIFIIKRKNLQNSPPQSNFRKESSTRTNLILNSSPISSKQKASNLQNKSQLQTIEKLLRVSNRIKIDMLRGLFQIEEQVFYYKLIDWAEKFGFRIDGDFIIVNNQDIDGFINSLDDSFADWSSNEALKEGKQ